MRRWMSATVLVLLVGCGGSSGSDSSPQATTSSGSVTSTSTTSSSTSTTSTTASPNVGQLGLDGLSSVRTAVISTGATCAAPLPYVAAEDEIDIGESPLEQMDCTVGGRTVGFAAWGTANDRGVSYTAALDLACSFGVVSISYLADGVWIAATNESTDADTAALSSLASELGVEVQTKTC